MLTGREGKTVKKSDTKVSDFFLGFLVKRLQKGKILLISFVFVFVLFFMKFCFGFRRFKNFLMLDIVCRRNVASGYENII